MEIGQIMNTKELALTICEMFQRDYPKRPMWQTMLEIEDLINKQRPSKVVTLTYKTT